MEMIDLINSLDRANAMTVLFYALSHAGLLAGILIAFKKPIVNAILRSGIFDELIFNPMEHLKTAREHINDSIEQIKSSVEELRKDSGMQVREAITVLQKTVDELHVNQLVAIAWDDRYSTHERIVAVNNVISKGYNGSLKALSEILHKKLEEELQKKITPTVAHHVE